MDSKFLFLVGVLILILSTCSSDAAPAESGIEGQVLIVQMCSAIQEKMGCSDHLPQPSLTVTNSMVIE